MIRMILFALLVTNSAYGIAQVIPMPDDTIRIYSNDYIIRDHNTGYSLQKQFLLLNDSLTTVLLTRDCNVDFGDEFGGELVYGTYVIDSARLLYYTLKTDIGKQTNTGSVSTTIAIRETFAFQKNGKIVRLTYESGRKGSALYADVSNHIFPPYPADH